MPNIVNILQTTQEQSTSFLIRNLAQNLVLKVLIFGPHFSIKIP